MFISSVYVMRSRAKCFRICPASKSPSREQGFIASRAGSEDIKKLLAVFFEQNVTTRKV